MRDIAEQEALCGDEGFEALGHVIEVVNEALELIRTGALSGGGLVDAGRESEIDSLLRNPGR